MPQMLKLPTNVGEWGFVIVLSLLFGGLAFAVIYSQVQLHDIKLQQAREDTESNLRVLDAQVRQYYSQHGRVEPKLTQMGIEPDALETRHAKFDDNAVLAAQGFTISARMLKYDNEICTLSFQLDHDEATAAWHD